jgi:hypothetical protein
MVLSFSAKTIKMDFYLVNQSVLKNILESNSNSNNGSIIIMPIAVMYSNTIYQQLLLCVTLRSKVS